MLTIFQRFKADAGELKFFLRCGAPTLCLRSDRETKPPISIIKHPSLSQLIIGLWYRRVAKPSLPVGSPNSAYRSPKRLGKIAASVVTMGGSV